MAVTYTPSGGTPSAGLDPKDDPSTESKDYQAMSWAWKLIHDILAGAKCIRECGETYLPKFQKESNTAYVQRLAAAPWRPEFDDALRSLCSKPFTKEVVVNPDAPDEIQGEVVDETTKKREGGIVDDIDGMGNSLHVFARETFLNGVAYGFDAIYVTYPAEEPAGPSRADEKEVGARPYWVHIRAENIIALLTKVVAGRTIVSHIRIKECTIEPDGFAEVEVERIRILELDDADKPTWQTYTKGKDGKYVSDGPPQLLSGVDEIPVALFFTGERSGNYRVKMPMLDLANMQIELYRSLSRKDQILTLTGSPMLVAKGMIPPQPTQQTINGVVVDVPASQIEVGPGTVLFAPPAAEGVQSDWNYIQPAAANIKEVRDDVNDVMEDFRRLALQPTTPKSGNLVATGQAIDAAKSHSAVEVWANTLNDALNQALMYTCQWLNIEDTVTAVVHTDFGVDVQGAEEAKVIGAAQQRGVLSKQTERQELARRGILGPDFDEDEEVTRIEDEQAGQDEINTLVPEVQIDPLTGKPIPPKPAALDPLTGLPIKPAPVPPVPAKPPIAA